MSAKTVHEWSTPVKTTITGAQQGAEPANTMQFTTQTRSQVRTITPMYKTGSPQATNLQNGGLKPNAPSGDYKEEKQQEHFKLRMIEPKTSPMAPTVRQESPSRPRTNMADFPSQHSKRSFLKLEPIAQRRPPRSIETRQITTDNYVKESRDRHNDADQSILRNYLEVREKDINQPWNKPARPAPRTDDPLKNLGLMNKTDSSKIQTLSNNKTSARNPNWNQESASMQRGFRAPFDPVLSNSSKVVYENDPRPSGAISEQSRVFHAQQRVVFESQPKPHYSIGHFSKRHAVHPDQTTFENQAPHLAPVDLTEPHHTGQLLSPSRQHSGPQSAALIYQSDQPPHADVEPMTTGGNDRTWNRPTPMYPHPNAPQNHESAMYSRQFTAPSLDSLNHAFYQYQAHDHKVTVPAVPKGPKTLPKPQISREQLESYQQPSSGPPSSVQQQQPRQEQFWNQTSHAFSHVQQQDQHYQSSPSLHTTERKHYVAAPMLHSYPQSHRAPQLKPFDVDYQRRLAEQKQIERESARLRERQQLEAYHRQIQYEQQRAAQQRQHQHQPVYHGLADTQFTTQTPSSSQQQFEQPETSSWKRTYPVKVPRPEEIVGSQPDGYEDDDYKESYYVDLVARREAFIDKLEEQPPIMRTGRRWQPPPEKPKPLYIPRQPLRAFDAQDDGEHRWRPTIYEPEYKYERKNFTPEGSPTRFVPDLSPLPGSLDEAAKRQTQGLLPASHRPRMPPVQQVAMRIVSPQHPGHRTRSIISESSLEMSSPAAAQQPLIYQDAPVHLKPHPSTLTLQDRPVQSGGVRKRVQQIEHIRSHTPQPLRPQPQTVIRQRSSSNPHTMIRVATEQPSSTTQRPRRHISRQQQYQQQLLQVPTSSQQHRVPTPSRPVVYPNPLRIPHAQLAQQQQQQRRTTPDHLRHHGHNIPPAPAQPQQGANEARTMSLGDLLSMSTVDSMQKRLDDDTMSPLNELAAIRARLEEKARQRQVDYKGINSEIQKTDPEFEPRLPPPVVAPPKAASPIERSHSVTVMEDCNHYKLVSPAVNGQSDDSGYNASTDASTTTWQFSENAFSPRSVISVNGFKDDSGLLKVRTDLSDSLLDRSNARAQTQTYQSTQTSSSTSVPPPNYPYMLVPVALDARYNSLPQLSNTDKMQSTLVKIQDENAKKPNKSIIKAKGEGKSSKKDAATKTEEITRVEEIERTVRTHKKKDKNRQRNGYGRRADAIEYSYQNGGTNGVYNRGAPMITAGPDGRIDETWTRQTTTRRERDRDSGRYIENGSAYRGSMRGAASQQDTLRRGETKYLPNGELRERRHSTHRSGSRSSVNRSSSQRDLYGGFDQLADAHHRRTSSSYAADSRRNSMMPGQSPIIEYPPTLPRGPAPAPPPHRNINQHNVVANPRSFNDWETGGRDEWALHMRRYGDNDNYTPLKREFDASVNAPLPQGTVNEHDHRTENIPGGYETFSRDSKANQGTRERNGVTTQFNESKQEVSYKREIGADGREIRRR